MNYDCSNKFDLDGDVYISGYFPVWFKSYDFKADVYVGCSTVIYDGEVNSKLIHIKGSFHNESCSCNGYR